MSDSSTTFKPKISIRTVLILIFILFSVVPLGVVTVYSIYQYKRAIDQENYQKLKSRFSELERELARRQNLLQKSIDARSSNRRLFYYLINNQYEQTVQILKENLIYGEKHQVDVYTRTGDLFARVKKSKSSEIVVVERGSVAGFKAPVEFLNGFSEDKSRVDYKYFDYKKNELVLNIFQKILTDRGRLVGYLQENVVISQKDLEEFRGSTGLVTLLTDGRWNRIYSNRYNVLPILSDEPVLLDKTPKVYAEMVAQNKGYSQFKVNDEPYGLYLTDYTWGEDSMVAGVGSSIASSMVIIENVNRAFFLVVLTITGFLFLMWWLLTKKFLSPIDELVSKIQLMQKQEQFDPIEQHSNTELGLVTKTFNSMSKDIIFSQQQLKSKVNELESANVTIKKTQSQLIHSAKMASLGQLVAGVAHELNNPISFISSNMLPLREYFQSLLLLIKTAEKNPDKLEKVKQDIDFEFIKKDLPKVIESCEEGAKRTHTIVLGLRSFSRLGEAELKAVHLADNINSTLQILAPQLKGRIEVVKDFEPVPQVTCYPSQLNQVFMNIISNAAQSVQGEGSISIHLYAENDKMICISIRDTGSGMSEETLQRIFEPFFTTKEQGVGTGLGLSISFGIIEKHGGTIVVSSEIGKGTEFLIRLPRTGPANIRS